MTDPKYEALKGEWESVPGFLFFGPDAEREVVHVGASELQRLIGDPQAFPEDQSGAPSS